MENTDHANTKCCCPCHKMKGLFIVAIGLVFLLGEFGVISQHAVNVAWPSLVILAGLKKLIRCKCCSKS
jgi:hypothetical protein